MTTPHPPRILIAGGGTGGHLFPALAIAEALQALAPECQIRFAGSRHGIEHTAVPARGYPLYRIPVRGLYGVSWARRLRVLALLPAAFVQCAAILLWWRPRLVIGVGGYASGPMLATALLLRKTCVIQEQNAYPGLTNRLLGRRVRAAFTAVEDTQGFFRRAIVTGNPVRRAILDVRDLPPLERDPPLVLVVGGSQGAHVLNQAMSAALPRLRDWGRPLRILHQTGQREWEAVRAAHQAETGGALEAEARPFIEDMADAYRRARLVVSRAGASAVSEIAAVRRASLLVPIPGASGDHQRRNALRLADAGAAVLIEQADLTGDRLAGEIIALLDDPARLDAMEAATDPLFKDDPAAAIAKACLEMLVGKN